MTTKNLLADLQKLPALDAPTQSLFQAIRARNAEAVLAAFSAGADPNAVEPFFAGRGPDEVEGGNTPLQEALCVHPQKLVDLPVLRALLDNGANPADTGISGDDALTVACQRMPANGADVIALMAKHGAAPSLDHVRSVLVARRGWTEDTRTWPHGEEGILDALWSHLSSEQKQTLDASWMMMVAPDHSQPLSYAQVKMVQWISNHATAVPKIDLQARALARRETKEAPQTGSPSRKLH